MPWKGLYSNLVTLCFLHAELPHPGSTVIVLFFTWFHF